MLAEIDLKTPSSTRRQQHFSRRNYNTHCDYSTLPRLHRLGNTI